MSIENDHVETPLTASAKRRRTQWAAQFAVASELARRGYTVAFTMGNYTPTADLMVRSPREQQFWVDVKGLSAKNAWLVSNKQQHADLYYVLVYLPPLAKPGAKREADRFFVLMQSDVARLSSAYLSTHPNDKNIIPGFGWRDPHEFEDAWHKLPQ